MERSEMELTGQLPHPAIYMGSSASVVSDTKYHAQTLFNLGKFHNFLLFICHIESTDII
jgi:hypothetical protein